MLKQGIHPRIVQERLGHSSVQITLDTCSHVLPGLQEAAARSFHEGLQESQAPVVPDGIREQDGYSLCIPHVPYGTIPIWGEVSEWLMVPLSKSGPTSSIGVRPERTLPGFRHTDPSVVRHATGSSAMAVESSGGATWSCLKKRRTTGMGACG